MSAKGRDMRRANQVVQTLMLAVMAAAFVVVTASANGAELKFHPAPGIAPVVGRYLVTLDPSVTADLAHASAEALARAYVGQLEPFASSDVRQFAIAMLPARARTLSADSRVREVVEIPHPDDALAPPPSPSSVTAGLTRQHLVPITRDSSSSGTYLYDGSGNIRSIGTDSFVYDSVGRLTQATVQGNQQTFTYDPFGNRTATVTANGAIGCVGGCDVPDTAVTSPNRNHLSAATYDDAGNVTSEYGAAYTYDGTGTVRRATVGSDVRDFVYTADDERIAVRQGASWTWSVRDQGGKVLREFTSLETSPSPLTLTNHHWSKDYVWRSGLLLASVFPITPGSTSPTTTYHYHLDHLGTPRLVTKELGVLVGKHTYYPFGAEMNLTPTENAIELMKFTGHERDIVAATNGSVDYMHARYYNANLGRFLSIDPEMDIEQAMANPQMWNRYGYSFNNPLLKVDPDGKQPTVFQRASAYLRPYADVALVLAHALNGAPNGLGEASSSIAGVLDLTARTLNLGTATGSALGNHGDTYDMGMALSSDVSTACEAFVAIGTAAEGGRSVFNAFSGFSRAETAEMSGMLRDAAHGKGNFGIGSASTQRAEAMGKAWVGPEARVASDGKTLISKDGLRQYRPPSYKPKLQKTQANFEFRPSGAGQWQSNAHLDVE